MIEFVEKFPIRTQVGDRKCSAYAVFGGFDVMSPNNKSVLITGISGFVGSHMAKRLPDQGIQVYGLIRRRADGIVPHNLKKLA